MRRQIVLSKLKPKSEFSRNVLTLMIGTTIAQAIPISLSPILTRMYTPEDFGVLALFMAITSVFGSISSARYELAIMLPIKDEDAINIFALSFIIACSMSLILLIFIILLNDYLVSLLNNKEISFWLYVIPISVFFIGFFNILSYFNIRKKNYTDIQNATIIKAVVLVIVQLVFGYIKNGASGLLSGEIISRMFANLKLSKNILKNKLLLSNIKKIKILALAKKYKNFPKYNLLSTIANTLAEHLPFLMIPKIFNLSVSGYFSLSQKLISLPSFLIARSISQVYFQEISENKNKKIKNMPLLLSTMKKLIYIALPFSIIMFFFSPIVFELVFGSEWKLSGEIAKYLSLVFFISFVVSTLSTTLVAYGKLKVLANWQYLYLISSTCYFCICIYFESELKVFLFYYVIHEYILYSVYLYFIIKTVKKEDEFVGRNITKCVE